MSERLVVGAGNEQQAEAWSGEEGDKWVNYADFLEGSSRVQHETLLDAARIAVADHVLDIGCGNGGTTRDAARTAREGRSLGIDLSTQMLERARAIAAAEHVRNVEFVNGDAQVYPFEPDAFDVAISKFGSMFFADQVGAFTNIGRALRPGGRLTLVSWQDPSRIEFFSEIGRALTLGVERPGPPPDAPSPFRHADPDFVRQMLASSGFNDIEILPLSDLVTIDTSVEGAFEVIMALYGWMTAEQSDADRAKAQNNLRASLQAHVTADGITYGTAFWLIKANR